MVCVLVKLLEYSNCTKRHLSKRMTSTTIRLHSHVQSKPTSMQYQNGILILRQWLHQFTQDGSKIIRLCKSWHDTKKHPTRVLLLFNAYPYGQRESGRILLWSQCLILVAHAKFCGKHARILFFCGISLFVLEELACTLNAVLPTVCALHFLITRNCHYNYWWCSLLHLWATYIHCHSVQLFRWMIFYLIWSNSHSGTDKISFS